MTFNFTTNIEQRMPTTGKVFFVDRMTSDYAQAHPFDVDAFIESVCQEFAGTEFAESREQLHRVWTSALSDTSLRGDASLYPNRNGQRRAAAMKVWHKAGDYWRRGLRLGDVLPAITPACRITRTADGWIALFPKDAPLLEHNEPEPVPSEIPEAPAPSEVPAPSVQAPAPSVQEPVPSAAVPQQPEHQPEHQPSLQSILTERKRKRLEHEEAIRHQHSAERFCRSDQPRPKHRHPVLKPLALFAAACAFCVSVFETGLLIPLGLVGLATSGLVK